jgi:BMFP domain-containing protein YqiC
MIPADEAAEQIAQLEARIADLEARLAPGGRGPRTDRFPA